MTNPRNPDGRKVTLRDIAKKAGVSHVAVSHALRNNPQVSAETRARVQKIAEEMGYQPDPMLSALSNYRLTKQDRPVMAGLAWINPLRNPAELRKHQEFDLYWKGALNAVRKLGFRLEEFRSAEIPLKRMESMFKARNIRGIILVKTLPRAFQDETIDWENFAWQDFATVRFGRKVDFPKAHFVTSAQMPNTIMAFKRMAEKGYRRIGFVGEYTEARVFAAGFLFAQQAILKKNRIPPLFTIEEEASLKQNEEILKHWLEKNKPDAILTDRPFVQQMLKNLGYRIPDDIGLATTSIHDTSINAGIDQNPEKIGQAAVRVLASLINHSDFGIPSIRNEILVDGKWVDGTMLPDRNSTNSV